MIKSLKIRKTLSFALCCLLFLSSFGTCMANQITLEELNQLDSNLTKLSNINKTLSNDLIQSKQALIQVRTELVECQKELLLTQTELLKLSEESKLAKQDLKKAGESLQTANESLTKYEKEVKSEIRSLKLQRDLTVLGLLVMAFKK